MSHRDEDRLPSDVDDVVRMLRDNRPEATAMELDQIKMRARARVASRPRKGSMRTRILAALATCGLMAATTGGVIAANDKGNQGNGNGNGGAAQSQYKPGKGCGDQNSEHTPKPGTGSAKKPCPPTAGPKEEAGSSAKKPKK